MVGEPNISDSRREANKLINAPLTAEQFEILKRVSFDPFFFSTFIYVINAVSGKVKFDLYPYQKSVLWSFIHRRFNIILKFRQAGITELISLFCLWYAMFHPNKNINIISIKDTVAKKVLRKIKFMYRNLPEFLKVQIVNGRTKDLGTASEMEFANGSIITSIPTTEEAGRSESLSLLVIDEAAIIRWADQIWAAAFPTLSTGGRAILNSCITGDTEIMTDKGPLRVDTICPPVFGKWDVTNLGYKALTHTGEYKPIIGAVNKGELETWEVVNSRGRVLKATPAHKLLTIKGWKSIREIIENKDKAIFYDLSPDIKIPVTKKPKIGSGARCSSVYTSKLKIRRKYIDNIYDVCVEKNESYLTKTEFINHNTPYGIGNFFHKKWVEACSGGNEFTPIRLKWRMHPERDIDWYRQMSTALGPRRTAQEIDGDFLTSGASVFDLMDIRAIEENLDQYIPLNIRKDPMFSSLFKGDIRQLNEFLRIFKKPDKNGKYSIGADIATGRSRDYSAFTIMDQKGEEFGSFKMKLPVNELSLLLGRLGKIYNRATLAPESNDIGLAVSSKLQEQNYPNLHYSVKLIKQKREKRPKEEKIPGWYTTSRNRPIIISELEEDIRLGNVEIKDEAFVQEAYTFIYDDKNKPIAMGKGSQHSDSLADDDDAYVDDAILGKAITNHVRKIKQRGLIVLPQ